MRTGTAIVIFSILVCGSWTTSQAFQEATTPTAETGVGTAAVVSEESADPNAVIMQEASQLFIQGDEAGAMAKADAYNATQEVKIPSKIRLAVLALQLRNMAKARQLFREVLKDDPTVPEPYIILADWNRGQGNLIEAQLLYEKGLSLAASQTDDARSKNSKIQALTGLAQIANNLDDFAALKNRADQLLAICAKPVNA